MMRAHLPAQTVPGAAGLPWPGSLEHLLQARWEHAPTYPQFAHRLPVGPTEGMMNIGAMVVRLRLPENHSLKQGSLEHLLQARWERMLPPTRNSRAGSQSVPRRA